MKSVNYVAYVVKKIPYQESDVLLTLFTEESGLLTCLAKGIRKEKSKNRVVTELFCRTKCQLLERSGTGLRVMQQAVLDGDYRQLAEDYDWQMVVQEALKRITTMPIEPSTAPQVFSILDALIGECARHVGADNEQYRQLVFCWFAVQLLDALGLYLDTHQDVVGQKIDPLKRYSLNAESLAFSVIDETLEKNKNSHFAYQSGLKEEFGRAEIALLYFLERTSTIKNLERLSGYEQPLAAVGRLLQYCLDDATTTRLMDA
jgi:DNA repair protein RecO